MEAICCSTRSPQLRVGWGTAGPLAPWSQAPHCQQERMHRLFRVVGGREEVLETALGLTIGCGYPLPISGNIYLSWDL